MRDRALFGGRHARAVVVSRAVRLAQWTTTLILLVSPACASFPAESSEPALAALAGVTVYLAEAKGEPADQGRAPSVARAVSSEFRRALEREGYSVVLDRRQPHDFGVTILCSVVSYGVMVYSVRTVASIEHRSVLIEQFHNTVSSGIAGLDDVDEIAAHAGRALADRFSTSRVLADARHQKTDLAKRTVVAVFDLEDSTGRLEAHQREQLSEYLATLSAEKLSVSVVPRAQIRARLIEEKSEGTRPCFDENCQIELGKALAAEKSLATRVIELGGQCTITANLFDLKTETTERAATIRTPCDDASLTNALDRIVQSLGT